MSAPDQVLGLGMSEYELTATVQSVIPIDRGIRLVFDARVPKTEGPTARLSSDLNGERIMPVLEMLGLADPDRLVGHEVALEVAVIPWSMWGTGTNQVVIEAIKPLKDLGSMEPSVRCSYCRVGGPTRDFFPMGWSKRSDGTVVCGWCHPCQRVAMINMYQSEIRSLSQQLAIARGRGVAADRR